MTNASQDETLPTRTVRLSCATPRFKRIADDVVSSVRAALCTSLLASRAHLDALLEPGEGAGTHEP
jgi:hypothetical protein